MSDKKFVYGMDPDDVPDTPENRRRFNDMKFYFWKGLGVKPEEVGDATEAYAHYLKTGEVSDEKFFNGF